jgi:hypothetical protein
MESKMTKLCRSVVIAVFGLLCLSLTVDHPTGPASSGLLLAQNSCSGGWLLKAAKVPGSKVDLSLSTTKDGQKLLRWSPHTDFFTQWIYQAKGPANAKGEIEMCGMGIQVSTFKDSNSISLRDLKEAQKLQPDYYAIRVIIWSNEYDPTTPTQKKGSTSDWITVQIE